MVPMDCICISMPVGNAIGVLICTHTNLLIHVSFFWMLLLLSCVFIDLKVGADGKGSWHI